MFCVGLTGGIGTGKTLACEYFASYGVDIIDTDVIARDLLMKEGALYNAVREHMGDKILLNDGSIDRKALRHVIFNHPHEKKWLENLMHPVIREQAKTALDYSKGPYAIMAIPLLSQANQEEYPFLNRICVIEASQEMQILRTMTRDHVSREAAMKIIAHQIPSHERLSLAHDIIENNGDQESFQTAIARQHQQYLVLAKK